MWYTLADALTKLNAQSDELITWETIIDLAIDGKISLCLHMAHIPAKKAYSEKPDYESKFGWSFGYRKEGKLYLDEDVLTLEGIYTLSNTYDFNHHLAALRLNRKSSCTKGTWVTDSDGQLYQVLKFHVKRDREPTGDYEPRHYYSPITIQPALDEFILTNKDFKYCLKLFKKKRNPPTNENILDNEEAAAYLKVEPATLNQSRSDGVLLTVTAPPHHKRGGQITYNKIDLDNWLAQSKPRITTN